MLKPLIAYFRSGPDRPLLPNAAAIASLYERKRWSIFLSLIAGYGFFYTCRLGLSVTKKPLLDAGVLTAAEMGVVGSVLLYVYAIGKFVNGMFSDHANIRRFMSWALLLSALANLAFGFTSVFIGFVILWGLNGWFQSIGSAPSVVSICQWFSNRERGTRYGIWAGAHNLGEGMTFIFVAWLVNHFGWRAGFVGPGIFCLFVAFTLFRTLGDRPQTYGLPHVSDYKNDHSAGPPPPGTTAELQRQVFRNPWVWVLAISCALMYVARYAINNWAMLFLQETKHYSLTDAGFVMAGYPVMGFVGAAVSGWISDRFFASRRNLPTLIYGLLQTGGIVLLFLAPPGHRWIDAVAMGLFGFGVGGLIVFLAGLIAVDIMPKAAAGTVKGLIGMFAYVGAGTQDWISGFLLDAYKTVDGGRKIYDFAPVFYFWIGASILSMVLAATAWNVKPRE
ncbi:MAG: MFS transporter [Opitutaceae bacterium]|nr:MFS transporter [Opitutaceae bacterium]